MCKKQFLEYFSVESCKSCASEAKSEKCNDFDECSRMELDYFEKGFNSAKKEYEEKLRWIPVEEKLPERFTTIMSNYCACKCVTEGFRHHKIEYFLCVYRFDTKEWISTESAKRYHVTHWLQVY